MIIVEPRLRIWIIGLVNPDQAVGTSREYRPL